MKSIAVLLTVLAFLASSNASGNAPVPKCYNRRTKCCWKYAPCGVKVVLKPTPAKCPVKACGNKCFEVCKPIVATVTKRKCWKVLSYKRACHNHPWQPKICVSTPVLVQKCSKFEVKEAKMPCKKVCTDICSVTIKPCTYNKVYHYPKYCPKLACAKAIIKGDSKSPAVFISKTRKFIRSSTGPRIDKIKH